MKEKYAIVVNTAGFGIFIKDALAFVLVETVVEPVLDKGGKPTGENEAKEVPHGYAPQDGERLIYNDVSTALAMRKPRWNGQGWEETATAEEIEATLPPLEDVRTAKLAELGTACQTAIYAGISIGNEHYSLTINDQTNISNLAAQAQAGATVLYHADGQLCRPYPPEEMLALATKAIEHKTKHTTLCNHYNVWVRRVQTRQELTAISYGHTLSSDLAESMKTLMGWGDSNE